jgi:uncharacterized protein YndB with AHSA1/START domain/DNA-binding transcriptional ArsR family regulator
MAMDLIFKALADDTRRMLLDRLRERDGQTLTELESVIAKSGSGMTRFGVMKHLNQLEAAGLIVTRKDGRFKHHHLNAAPLQQVVDRWIEPLTQQPMARALLDLKAELEGVASMSNDQKPDFVLETFIRTTPEKLWAALTDGELTKRYHFAAATLKGETKPGAAYAYIAPDGGTMLSGEILASDPPKRLEMTFTPGWMPNAKTSRCVYEITPVGATMKLTVLHYDIPPEQAGVSEGWAKVAASLKSFLETGEGLSFA